jgi:hypothetical protein
VLDGVAYVGDVEGAVPQVDAGCLAPGEDSGESAHDGLLITEKEL